MFNEKEYSQEYNQRPEVKKRNQEYRKNHLEERQIYMGTYKEKNKFWLARKDKLRRAELFHLDKVKSLTHYSNPQGTVICNNCGDTNIDVLCIDHIDGNGGKHRKEINIIGSGFYTWLIKNNYPEGYQVLCWNCNREKELYK